MTCSTPNSQSRCFHYHCSATISSLIIADSSTSYHLSINYCNTSCYLNTNCHSFTNNSNLDIVNLSGFNLSNNLVAMVTTVTAAAFSSSFPFLSATHQPCPTNYTLCILLPPSSLTT
jgi:hypothetical protein